MAIQQPKTIYQSVTQRINALLHQRAAYWDPQSFVIKSLESECKKLCNAEPAAGWVCYARVAQLVGDVAEFRRCVENAIRLGAGSDAQETLAKGLNNLGFFSESQEAVLPLTDPRNGQFSSYFDVALFTGAYRAVHSYSLIAVEQMNLDLPPNFDQESVRQIAGFMERRGLEDKDVAKALDVAGTIMRSRNLIQGHDSPEAHIVGVDGQPVLHFRFLLEASPSDVADANMELAEAFADGILRGDDLHLSFGVL